MSQTESRQSPTDFAKSMQVFAQRALEIQAEFANCLVKAQEHWIGQFQTEFKEAQNCLRHFSESEGSADKFAAIQTWWKDATARHFHEMSFAIETARALGGIEVKLFGPVSDGCDRTSRAPKAA